MLKRSLLGRFLSMQAHRPLYESMQKKFMGEFAPTLLQVDDVSASHAEHEAMRQSGYMETHFRITIVSEKFAGKMPVQRHRMIYALLDEEFAKGLHAITINAKTPAEHEKTRN